MTFCAAGRIVRLLVIRLPGRQVVVAMAVYTVITDSVEAQVCLRHMAFRASLATVRAGERKSDLFMQLGYVIDKPVLCCMASGASITDSHVVNIGMTADALC